jgi:hypothetical protein
MKSFINGIVMIESRDMSWAGHVACMGKGQGFGGKTRGKETARKT